MLYLRSHLRRKLLTHFFVNPAAEHYLRELAILLDVKPANLSRELAALVRQGLFHARISGRQKYFRINKNYPLYQEYRRIVLKTIGVAGRLRETMAGIPGIREAHLFGSFARGQEDDSSDIDVLIIGKPPAERLEEEIRKLERQFGRAISYTLMSPKEFRERQSRRDSFLADIWRHKRVGLVAK